MIPDERLRALRDATPGWGEIVHFSHGGASPMSAASFAAIQEHLELESRIGSVDAANAAFPQMKCLRADVARLLNAEADEVAFQSSGTAAFEPVWASLPALRPGDRILVSRQEWGPNLTSYQRGAQHAGASLEVMPSLSDGRVDIAATADLLDERVRWLSLTLLPANGGLIHDAAALGAVARAAGVPYFIDAGQALGQLPVDVQALGCDVLNSASRKHLRGPRGTAVIYVRRGFLQHLDPVSDEVHSVSRPGPVPTDSTRFDPNELPLELLLGLREAVRLALDLGVDAIADRIQSLAARLRSRLSEEARITVLDEGTSQLSGLVSFNLDGVAAAELQSRLATHGFRVGAIPVPYAPLDMTTRNLQGVVRASLSYLNSDDDIERLVRAMRCFKS